MCGETMPCQAKIARVVQSMYTGGHALVGLRRSISVWPFHAKPSVPPPDGKTCTIYLRGHVIVGLSQGILVWHNRDSEKFTLCNVHGAVLFYWGRIFLCGILLAAQELISSNILVQYTYRANILMQIYQAQCSIQ